MNTPQITEAPLPEASRIRLALPGADFADCYVAADPAPGLSPMQAWLDTVACTPAWTRLLMAWRNRLVRLVGLKDLGGIGELDARARRKTAAEFRVGDRVGIFDIRHLGEDEVLMGQDDRHLEVQVSLCKRQRLGADGRNEPVIALGTVVHIHNPLGRAYMGLITPFHRLIAPAMLRAGVRAMSRPQADRSPHAPG